MSGRTAAERTSLLLWFPFAAMSEWRWERPVGGRTVGTQFNMIGADKEDEKRQRAKLKESLGIGSKGSTRITALGTERMYGVRVGTVWKIDNQGKQCTRCKEDKANKQLTEGPIWIVAV